jgi:DNA-binding LacI/PurR family transcriptional regulator
MKAGDVFPSVEALSTQYAVSVNTVMAALSVLEREGWIERRHGSGVFATSRAERPCVGLYSELDLLNRRSSVFFREVPHALWSFFSRNGVQTEFYMGHTQPGEDPVEPTCRRFFADVESGVLDGVVVVSAPQSESWTERFRVCPVPLVNGAVEAAVGLSTKAVQAGVQRLAEQGCRRPAMVVWGPELHKVAFSEAAEAAGMETRQGWIRSDVHPGLAGGGWDQFRELWSAYPEKPDGLLVLDDGLFEDVKLAIREMGIRVPGQLRVVAHANKGFHLEHPFPVTLLECDPVAFAEGLGELLLQRMHPSSTPESSVETPMEIIAWTPRPERQAAEAGVSTRKVKRT